MKPERWKQVDELLEAALECPATERASFLDRACSGDEELRHEVESLLVSDGQAEAFIESPPARVAGDLFTHEQPKPRMRDRIAHYQILEQIGSGGMGEVYLARDTTLGRNVALKLLPPSFTADPQLRARFLREAQVASSLDHPNICTIHEIGQSSSFLFIAMQYVEGVNLNQLVSSGPLKLDALLSISLQATDALAAAHDQGIIHRDIKSNNIIITPRGQVKVLDFGLAKLIDGRGPDGESEWTSPLTRTDTVMGTPSYMSPEQARGERIDHRSDIFSLGVVIYEMAIGDVPFKKTSQAEAMNAVINEPHTPAAELNEEIPAELSAVIDRALSKDPADRYQNMREMLHDLRGVGRAAGLLGSSDSQGVVVPYVPLRRVPRRPMWAEAARRRSWQAIVFGIAIVMIVAAGTWLLWSHFRARPQFASGRVMLAVLPFKNLTGDAAQDYFSDGLTEEMIVQLGNLDARRLGVIARTSVMRYKNREEPLDWIGRQLGVQYVLEGSVRRDSDKVRITAQLIQMKDQTHLWAREYDRELSRVLSLQSEIAQQVADEIQLTLGDRRPIKLAFESSFSPATYEAYDLYLRGQYFWNKRTTQSFRQAIEYFQQAVTKDASYARAYAGLANTHVLMGGYGGQPQAQFIANARSEARRALQLDEELPEAHTALALILQNYDWDWETSDKEYRRAIELNPNYATAHHWYAEHLALLGHFDEALRESERARELDPLSLIIATDKGHLLYFSRQYDRAIGQLRAVLEMDPNFQPAHVVEHAYVQKSMFAEAEADLEKWRSVDAPWSLAESAYLYGRSGQLAEARRILEKLEQLDRRQQLDPALMFWAHLGMGNNDRAFELLEEAYSQHSNILTTLKADPAFDPLRNDPRFQDLLRRVGLAQ